MAGVVGREFISRQIRLIIAAPGTPVLEYNQHVRARDPRLPQKRAGCLNPVKQKIAKLRLSLPRANPATKS
jgi:hypothetical protein